MPTALPSFLEKLARLPDAPAPELLYSPNTTLDVRESPAFHSRHPAPLMTPDILVFWKTTRA